MQTTIRSILSVAFLGLVLNASHASAATGTATAPSASQSAANQKAVTACGGSIYEPGFPSDAQYYLEPDSTQSWTYVYKYNYTLCSAVPILATYLWDDTIGQRYTCTFTQFSASGSATVDGTITSVCKITEGAMVGTTDPDWYMSFKFGYSPTYYERADYFTVNDASTQATITSSVTASATSTADPGPTTSAAMRKRKRMEQAGVMIPSSFRCGETETACAAGRKGMYKCVDTRTNLEACGACADQPGSQDCSDIVGASHVQCIMGSCIVNACERGFALSQNGTSCVPSSTKVSSGRGLWDRLSTV